MKSKIVDDLSALSNESGLSSQQCTNRILVLKTKLTYFLVFLSLGVVGAHSFTIGHAALRLQWMHPARPRWPEGLWTLWLGTQFNWLGTISLILSIYFSGIKKQAGWYLGLMGGITIMMAGFWTYLVRGTTSDYILQGFFGLITVVLLLTPFIKNRVYEEF